jgi:hypothetical protein
VVRIDKPQRITDILLDLVVKAVLSKIFSLLFLRSRHLFWNKLLEFNLLFLSPRGVLTLRVEWYVSFRVSLYCSCCGGLYGFDLLGWLGKGCGIMCCKIIQVNTVWNSYPGIRLLWMQIVTKHGELISRIDLCSHICSMLCFSYMPYLFA